MGDQPIAFDRTTGRRFVRAITDFLTSEVRWRARGLFALFIVFALTINGFNVVNSYVVNRRWVMSGLKKGPNDQPRR
jgi:hypothetical protein